MQELGDVELVQEYARSGSEEAFGKLVARHLNLVYAAAMRQVGNPHQAEEITQAVFTILANKAGSFGKKTILAGWLFNTTRLTAANLRRSELRRAHREQEAYMQSMGNEANAEAEAWKQIAPLLDTAIAGLGEKDRNAVVMRYIEGKGLQEVGLGLGTTEAAAQKRVNRAVEKLRKFFSKRGVVLTGAMLGCVMVANSAPAAPAGLVLSVKAVAVTKGAAAGASTLALIKGTLKTMAWTKIKFAAAAGVAALILAGGGITTINLARANPDGLSASDIGRKAREKYNSITSYSDTGKVMSEIDSTKFGTTFTTRFGRPNFYRLEWEQIVNASSTNKGAVWSAGDGAFMINGDKMYYKVADDEKALAMATGISGGASSIPATFLKVNFGDALAVFVKSKAVSRKQDEKVAGMDCYVLTTVVPAVKTQANGGKVKTGDITSTLWIGKADYLIHQRQQIINGMDSSGFKPAKPNTIEFSAKKIAMTETHENIVLDEAVTKEDFKHEVPAGMKPMTIAR